MPKITGTGVGVLVVSIYVINIYCLVQLRTGRDVVVHHEKMEALLAFLLVDSGMSIPQESMPIMAATVALTSCSSLMSGSLRSFL